jgi:signal transduction histidine kinase
MMNMAINTPNEFLLSVLEGLVDGILILNPQGELIFANTSATEQLRSGVPVKR